MNLRHWIPTWIVFIVLVLISAQFSFGEKQSGKKSAKPKYTKKQKKALKLGPIATIKNMQDARKIRQQLSEFEPKVGETSPDFLLSDEKGKNETLLSEVVKEKSVVLIFGSYT